jgi:hypothetical protein
MADDPVEPAKGDDTKDLGDAGKKALDEERKARRDAEKALKDAQTRLQELEDRDKSETQKLADRIAQAEKRAADAEANLLRHEVAAAKGVKARWLSGTTREELEAAADEYLADHPPAPGDTPPPGRPVEDLRGGGDPDEQPVETNPRKLAESVPRL